MSMSTVNVNSKIDYSLEYRHMICNGNEVYEVYPPPENINADKCRIG